MADERRRQEVSEAAESEEATLAALKRQRTAPDEEEKEKEHAGGGTADVGEDILAWLTDLDEQAVLELMKNLFEPPYPDPAAAGKVSFSDDPWSPAQQPSYITINTGNEESCGSSFSDAPSVMASFDASGIAGGAWGRQLKGGDEEKSAACDDIVEWGFLADDDGDDVLARFLGEDLL